LPQKRLGIFLLAALITSGKGIKSAVIALFTAKRDMNING
jgi:hypothetical protein